MGSYIMVKVWNEKENNSQEYNEKNLLNYTERNRESVAITERKFMLVY